jgi:hypothetical protein
MDIIIPACSMIKEIIMGMRLDWRILKYILKLINKKRNHYKIIT